jgi:peptidoglycan/xylan/chitin deacetylase (PgdA/CDA1 family)
MLGSNLVFNALACAIGPFTAQKEPLQILMYHCVQDSPKGLHYVPAAIFRDHVVHLAKKGYRSVTVRQLRNGWPEILNGPKTVVLTFDDLWASHIDHCLPVLKEHGFVGTFFVPTGFIKMHRYRSDNWPFVFNSELGSWKDVETLKASGMEIGCHSHTHPKMSALSRRQAEEEIGKSTRILSERLNEPIESFCFPFGKPGSYASWIIRMLPEFGYTTACTTRWGRPNLKSDLFELPRIEINGWDNIHRFRRKLEGHFDFLRWKRS